MSITRSQEELIRIAEEAVVYAQSIIIKGATQLENNYISIDTQRSLHTGVSDVRAFYSKPMPWSIEELYAQHVNELVFHCTKYSLGNCYESAVLALYYVLQHYPDVDAEVYCIKDTDPTKKLGDHIVLVLNPDRMTSNVANWKGVFCDAWAKDKDSQVFLTSEYLTKLKNYRIIVGSTYMYRYLENFSLAKYNLQKVDGLNSIHLLESMTVNKLKSNLDNLTEKLKKQLDDIATDFYGIDLQDQIYDLINRIDTEKLLTFERMDKNKYPDAKRIGESFIKDLQHEVQIIEEHYRQRIERSQVLDEKNDAPQLFNHHTVVSDLTQKVQIEIEKLKTIVSYLSTNRFQNLISFIKIKNEIQNKILLIEYQFDTCIETMTLRNTELKAQKTANDFYNSVIAEIDNINKKYTHIHYRYEQLLQKEKSANPKFELRSPNKQFHFFVNKLQKESLQNKRLALKLKKLR